MKRPTFFQGVLVAGLLALGAGSIVAMLAPLLGLGTTLRLLIPLLGLVYILYLFSRSKERTGRATALAAWAVIAALGWWFVPPLALYLLIHVAAIWLLRSLYFYSGVLPSVLDLGLSALSISAAAWAATQSGSVFLATWSFFLVQALFVAIPPAIGARNRTCTDAANENTRFERAKREADRALRQLFTQQRTH
ncbi:MAG TPA: hypothetical protein PKK10_00020 [Woeseiaceae bacterium]|nr:hypothetical protein [Woeseiaceae bacterium]